MKLLSLISLTIMTLLVSIQVEAQDSIPGRIAARFRAFEARQQSSIPMDRSEACDELLEIWTQAYPDSSEHLSYPSTLRTIPSANQQSYALQVGRAHTALINTERLLGEYECAPVEINDKCCKKGTTRDTCKSSTSKNCKLDGYDWCTSSSNACDP